MSLDWAAELQRQPGALPWCFLRTGAQHELAPIISGHQVSLVYDVCAEPASRVPDTLIDFTASPVGCVLQAALGDKAFLPKGGRLTYSCCQHYDHVQPAFSVADLRGADLAVHEAASQLGLAVQLELCWQDPYNDDSLGDEEGYVRCFPVELPEDPVESFMRNGEPTGDDGSHIAECPFGQDGFRFGGRPCYQMDPRRVAVRKRDFDVGRSALLLRLCIPPWSQRRRR